MPSTTWTASLAHSVLLADGSQRITVLFTDSADSHVMGSLTYLVAADGSSVKDERTGLVIASPAPAGLISAGSSYASQLNTIISNGVTAGKIKP